MWGYLLHRRVWGYRPDCLKLLAESFRNLAATQMLEARRPKGQRAVPTSMKKLRDGPQPVVHHTVVSAGTFAPPAVSSTSPLASRTRPYTGVVTGSPVVLATHTNSPRRKARTPSGAPSHSTASPAPRSARS